MNKTTNANRVYALFLFVTLAIAAANTAFAQAPKKGAFDGASAIWKKVMAHSVTLDTTIKTKDLKNVHHHAFDIRDQVKLLPAKSKSLSKDVQAKLAKGVASVSALASQLDEAGDGKKQAEAEALNKKLHTVLGAIAGLYPKGALKG